MEKAGTARQINFYYLLAILINIGLLVFFKYINFFISSIFDLINFTEIKIFHSSAPATHPDLLNIIAPLGISYITFQAIGYLIEIKRGNHKAETNLGHFSIYLFFFSKITAGPIERAHDFLPQLKQPKSFTYENVSSGLKKILWGLFKKLVIANRLSLYIDAVFPSAREHSGITLFLASIFYVLELYADFSGYTDIALGTAKVLGYDLMPNFNRPLFSKSVTELWRKWHISLSSWFADYFYTPITIAKREWGNWSVAYAFFVTFIVLGFWHGANWTFIIFGALHAMILTIEFFTKKIRKKIRKKVPAWLNNIAGIFFTISFFALSLVFFKSDTVSQALLVLKKIFTAKGSLFILKEEPSTFVYSILGVLCLLILELNPKYYAGDFSLFGKKNWLIQQTVWAVVIIVILLFGVFDGGQFIYYKF